MRVLCMHAHIFIYVICIRMYLRVCAHVQVRMCACVCLDVVCVPVCVQCRLHKENSGLGCAITSNWNRAWYVLNTQHVSVERTSKLCVNYISIKLGEKGRISG